MSTAAEKDTAAMDTVTTTAPCAPGTDDDDDRRGKVEVTAHGEDSGDAAASWGRSRIARRWGRAVLLGVLVVGLAVSTSWLGLIHHGDAAAAEARAAVATAAADAARAVLTYQPDTVTDDLARARAHLTGDFATYFSKLGTELVIPAAQQRQMASTATVAGTSVVRADADRAVALVFVNQVITSADKQEPAVMSSSLRMQLDRIDGRWLVSTLDTV